ncbi:antibiotic biosynthesis monooxygenase [Agromyces sp. GXQ0307]|uniref:antibiotic biosynthesis monooxygenase n=1 Tax=Agromyces sp. GXQ0307 TaxID=3377835 RepID=UPI00383A0764
MPIKVIIEMQAQPGRRDDLKRLLDDLVATRGTDRRGFIGSTRYEVLDDPDLLVEMADWDSVEARMEHLEEAMATNAFGPLTELMAAPFRVTVVRALE